MSCFTCGTTFKVGDRQLIMRLKREYEEKKIERYVYRIGHNEPLMIVKKEYFNEIFTSYIQPNFHKGAEYMHISEYTGA